MLTVSARAIDTVLLVIIFVTVILIMVMASSGVTDQEAAHLPNTFIWRLYAPPR